MKMPKKDSNSNSSCEHLTKLTGRCTIINIFYTPLELDQLKVPVPLRTSHKSFSDINCQVVSLIVESRLFSHKNALCIVSFFTYDQSKVQAINIAAALRDMDS